MGDKFVKGFLSNRNIRKAFCGPEAWCVGSWPLSRIRNYYYGHCTTVSRDEGESLEKAKRLKGPHTSTFFSNLLTLAMVIGELGGE
jgi:hypothetical protein